MPDNREKKSVLRILAYRQRTLDLLTGPPALAFVPAISLAAFWFGGEGALLVMATLVPAAYLLSGGFGAAVEHLQNSSVNSNGILARAPMTAKCEDIYTRTAGAELTACIHVIEIDRFGPAAGDTIVQRIGERLSGIMRDGDSIGQIGDARFAVCTSPVRQLSLELCIQHPRLLRPDASGTQDAPSAK